MSISIEDDLQRAGTIEGYTFFYEPAVLSKISLKRLLKTIPLSINELPQAIEKKWITLFFKKKEEPIQLQLQFLKCCGNQYVVSDATISNYLPLLTEEKEKVENTLKIKSFTVSLSYEILQGIQGERGKDHCIPLSLLQSCLEKKEKSLKKPIREPVKELDLYFKIEDNKGEQQILNIFVKKFKNESHPRPTVMVYTAYYVSRLALKQRWKLFAEYQFVAMLNSLPKVSYNQ